MKAVYSQCMASLALVLLSVFAIDPSIAGTLSQKQLQEFAGKSLFTYEVLTNLQPDGKFDTRVRIENQSDVVLPAGEADWRIYFHFTRRIATPETSGIKISWIQGDLYELSPTADFAGLAPGSVLDIVLTAKGYISSYSYFMPRAFILRPGLNPEIFANTDTEQLKNFVEPFLRPEQKLRFNQDSAKIATAASRYQENLRVNRVAESLPLRPRIVPTPVEIDRSRGQVTLTGEWHIHYAGRLAGEVDYLRERLKNIGLEINATPNHLPVSGKQIEIQVDSGIGGAEAYRLDISSDKITIVGADNAGAFYGIQSLLSLLPAKAADSHEIPRMTVVDAPRYAWRGMHYDLARNFHGKEVTLRLIEQMSRYKLNKLHLHLSDDEGWRLEIPGLPELHEVGAFRCFDLTEQNCLLTQLGTGPYRSGSGNGYYSTADFIDILRFASAHHVDVIPEIDMPGHSRAAIKSMEARHAKLLADGKKAEAEQFLLSDLNDKSQYLTVQSYSDNSVNVCLPSTYAFIDKVVYELQLMYRKAGAKFTTYHMGGDEVGVGSWTDSPACEALIERGESGIAGPADLKPYFVSKVAEITHKRGLALAAWEDGLMYDPKNAFDRQQFANTEVIANAWDTIWELGVADRAYRLANEGYKVILSPATHLYLDHPQETHPKERGYNWATSYSDLGKVFGFMPDHLYANAKRQFSGAPIENLEALVGRPLPPLKKPDNIKGIQGQLWAETIRTPEQLEKKIYPRLIALAERAWFRAPWEGEQPDAEARAVDLAGFARAISTRELPNLAAAGAAFYLPPPGAIVESGKLLANVSLPGLAIDYSLDEGVTWNPYQGATEVETLPVLLRSRLGDQVSRSAIID